MHEDLLGYLLGALDPDEMQRVARLLREDPEAREQLAELEKMVRPLEEGYVPVEPPPGDLVSRTLENLPPVSVPSDEEEAGAAGLAKASITDPFAGALAAGDGDSREVGLSGGGLVPMHAAVDSGRSSGLNWLDWVGGAAAAAVVLALLLPALAQGRFESRKIACQDQLRQFGTALTRFVTRSPQERLPAVCESGPEAFAGIYMVRLKEFGLVEDPSQRWCPSLDLPTKDETTLVNLGEIVSVDDLHNASVDRLQQIQQYAGGHYAYNLGVVDQEHFTPPRFEARSSFAVMADAPLTGIASGESWEDRIGHSGIGINVLFEDGRVRFIPIESLESLPDHPLVNHRGQVEAGVNIDDASLAPSWRPPFIDVPQR